jgi:hypothetical protein
MTRRTTPLDPAIQALCDRVILPALLERWRAEHAAAATSTAATAREDITSPSVHA